MSNVQLSRPERIKHFHRLAEEAFQVGADAINSGIGHCIEAGELLIEEKAETRHGEWLSRLKYDLGIGPRKAQYYMQLAKGKDELNAKRVSHLTLKDAIALLQSPKDQTEPPPPTSPSVGGGGTEPTAPVVGDAHAVGGGGAPPSDFQDRGTWEPAASSLPADTVGASAAGSTPAHQDTGPGVSTRRASAEETGDQATTTAEDAPEAPAPAPATATVTVPVKGKATRGASTKHPADRRRRKPGKLPTFKEEHQRIADIVVSLYSLKDTICLHCEKVLDADIRTQLDYTVEEAVVFLKRIDSGLDSDEWVKNCPPSLEMVVDYATAQGWNFALSGHTGARDFAQHFLDYEEESNWMSGSKYGVSWQAMTRQFYRHQCRYHARSKTNNVRTGPVIRTAHEVLAEKGML